MLLIPNAIFTEYVTHLNRREIPFGHFAEYKNGCGIISISATSTRFQMPSPNGYACLGNSGDIIQFTLALCWGAPGYLCSDRAPSAFLSQV